MSTSPFPPTQTHHNPSPKLTISTSPLPQFISPSQPPTKKTPFRQIDSIPFVKSVNLILPQELYGLILDKIATEVLRPRYFKFIGGLGDLVDPEALFWKNGSRQDDGAGGREVLLLSEGVPGVDDRFSLRHGVLKLDLSKEIYERSGLQGMVIKGTGARKHVRSRWRVEMDLGKDLGREKVGKGFGRLRRAAARDGALGGGKAWLGCNVGGGVGALEGELLRGLHPVISEARQPDNPTLEKVLVPDIISNGRDMPDLDEDQWWELLEWIDLAALRSPRIQDGDHVDSNISRYSVPEPSTTRNLKIVRWHGLMSSEWITKLLIELIKQSRICQSRDWIALSVLSHETEAVGGVDGYTVLLQPRLSKEDEANAQQCEEDRMDEDAKTGTSDVGSGLQRAVCFQLVDSVMA